MIYCNSRKGGEIEAALAAKHIGGVSNIASERHFSKVPMLSGKNSRVRLVLRKAYVDKDALPPPTMTRQQQRAAAKPWKRCRHLTWTQFKERYSA